MNYRGPKPITREAVKTALTCSSPEELCAIIVDATHSIADREWLEETCLRLLAHPEEEVRGTAITCLGHLARLHHQLNIGAVGEALTKLHEKEPKLRGRIEDAVDDIKTFTGENIELSD